MGKASEAKPQKKGFFAILKESMRKTSEGCGPDCGCHVEVTKDKAAGGQGTEDTRRSEKK